MNGVVLFLPHGFEGQGPEHSSGRIERFLQLAAGNNIQVAIPSTPANLFHILRRQVKMNTRLPLVVFTPKSLLRHPMVHSKIQDFTKANFLEIIDDQLALPELVEKVVFTSGRLYYDFDKYKMEHGLDNIAIVRLEQIYPIPEIQIEKVLKKYARADRILWAQDEPENMGAWPFLREKLKRFGIKGIARQESASPAVGLMEKHKKGLDKILDSVFAAKAEVVS